VLTKKQRIRACVGRLGRTAGSVLSVRGILSSPMSKGERSPNQPLDQQFRLGTGVQYSFNDKITVGAAYQYMNGGDADIDVERGPRGPARGRLQVVRLPLLRLELATLSRFELARVWSRKRT
jgi:hypothetical protein